MADGITLTLNLEDKASAAIKTFQGKYESSMQRIKASSTYITDKMSAGLEKIRQNWLAVTAVIAGFVYKMKQSIDAYLEQERATVQLANAMKMAGNYSEKAIKEMTDYASSLQMVTRYGDETILRMMNLLQTYRLSAEQTKWATQAALDFASATGTDAEGAARLVGMAIQGNIEQLARYIPALRSATNEQIANMSVAEKSALVVKVFNEQFSGRAQAEMQSYGAQLERLDNVMGEIKETVGKALVQAFINVQSETGDTTESFARFASIGAQAAYVVTIAFKTLVDTLRGLRAAFDLILFSLLKFENLTIKGEIAIAKLSLAFERWRGNTEMEKASLVMLADAQDRMVKNLQDQERISSDYNNQQRMIDKGNEELEQAFADLDVMIAGYGNTVVKTGDKMVKFTSAAKEAVASVSTTKLTDEMKGALDEYEKASADVTERIKELTLSEYDYKIYLLDEHVRALRKAGIAEVRLAELYALEKQKIEDDSVEKQKDLNVKLTETIDEGASGLRDVFKDIFLESSADDFDNFIERIGDKLKNFVADMGAAFITDMFTGGKMFDFAKMFGGGNKGRPAGVEGPLTESGGFTQATGLLSSIGSFVPVYGPAIAAVGTVASSIFSSLSSKSEANQQMREKRGQDFVDELNKWIDGEYTSIENMFLGAGEELFSGKGLYAARKYAGLGVSEWAYTWQKSMKIVRAESEQAGAVSVGSFRQMQDALRKVAVTSPEAAQQIADLQDKLNETFGKTLKEDVTDGLITVETAVKRLMSTGLDQLSAQTALFGEDYNELMIMMNGSIPMIDDGTRALNEMRDELDKLDEEIQGLPDSLGDAKKALENVSYAIRYLINMNQSIVTMQTDAEKLPDIYKNLSEALKEGDFEGAAREINELQYQSLEAASAFTQMAEAVKYLGAAQLGGVLAKIANLYTALSVLYMGFKFLVDVILWFKDLNKETDITKDKWDILADEIKNADLKDVISSITDKMREWEDVISRATIGDMRTDLNKMLDDLTYSLLEINRIADDLNWNDATKATAVDTAIAAYTAQIEDYFDALLKGFSSLRKEIKLNIQEIGGGRTGQDVENDMVDVWKKWKKIDLVKDPDEWLSQARELKDLIIEKYNIEKENIEATIDAYQSLYDSITSTLLSIKTGGLNPESAETRLTYYEQEAGRLRGAIAGESDPTKRAGLQGQLVDVLKNYLAAAEEVYTRPSEQYRAIYDAVIGELTALQTEAQNQVTAGEAELIRLQNSTIEALGYIDTAVGNAETAINSLKKGYLDNIVLYTRNTYLAQNTTNTHLSRLVALFEEKYPGAAAAADKDNDKSYLLDPRVAPFIPHQGGLPYVPYDNYKANLHKGERIMTAAENRAGGGPVTINLSVSSNAASGKDLAKELKQEIRYGELGQVIVEKIRRAA